ncbi:fibronectin type III domain-containing protein [Actinomadura gamaensis]|uniref:Fibronectin type III domain-containing protein n=1 Tax=Actinomadura gamaensis TaxID=1763541 RepID=A0ABV9U0N0_9ACTN
MSGDRTRGGPLRGLLRRDRLTGQLAFALVGVLTVSAIVYGIGTASARYRLSDVGSWLTATAKGMVVHANGLAGKVDGKANMIPQMRGHHVKVVQDGTTVLLIDTDTGVVSRIDPSQLTVRTSRDLGTAGVQVVVGGNAAYSVDAVKGTVQRIDPVSLAGMGPALTLPLPLGQAGIDAAGTLWVPAPKTGQLFPVRAGQQGAPVQVGRPGDALGLTIAAGIPVVTDSTSATALVVRPDGTQKINLPGAVARVAGGLKTPPVADGQTVPMLGDGGSLYLLNSGVGQLSSVALRVPGHEYEPPNILGPRVYLPDRTAGQLMIFNTETNDWERPVQASRPGTPFDVTVRDHMLWVNDPDGATAYAFDPNGAQKAIKKYDDKVPGGNRRPLPKPAPGGTGDGNNNNGGSPGDHGGNHPAPPNRRPSQSPSPPPGAPSAPYNLEVSSTDGGIRVRFHASTGGKPIAYTLKGTAGFRVTPARIPANSTRFEFTATGGDCAREYAFQVAVIYKDKDGNPAELRSEPSKTAHPCLAPGKPGDFVGKPGNHTGRFTWTEARGATGYRLSSSASDNDVTGSSYTVTGLPNNQQYEFTLTAFNGAGSSQGSIKTKLDLTYPNPAFQNKANDQTNTIVRPGAANSGEVGKILKGQYISITVICMVNGGPRREDQTGETSTWWDRIKWNGGVGYLSVTSMQGPRQPDDTVYECSD